MEKIAENRQLRWTNNSTQILLNLVIEKIKNNGEYFEKPVAAIFYNSLKEKSTVLSQYSWKSMRDKIKGLRQKYRAAIDWKNKSVQSVLESSEKKTVEDYITKICPFFNELDLLFGSSGDVNTEIVYDSTRDFSEDIIEKSCDVLDIADDFSYEIKCELRENGLREDASQSGSKAESPKAPQSFRAEQLNKFNKKRKRSSSNSTAFYLAKMQKEWVKYNKLRLESKKEMEIEKLKLKVRKIELSEEIQKRQLRMEERKIEMEEKKISEEIKLKFKELENKKEVEMIRIEKEIELKKFEIEMKIKYQK